MNRRYPATDVALIAAFAAMTAVCAQLSIKTFIAGVPLTLQLIPIVLAGAVLGAKRGFLAIVLYVVVGAAGLPVYSNGTGGLGILTGLTGGYLIAFPIGAFVTGWIVERRPERKTEFAHVLVAALIPTLLIIFPLGVAGWSWRGNTPLDEVFTIAAGFLPWDIVKMVIVASVATAVHRAFGHLIPVRSATKAEARAT